MKRFLALSLLYSFLSSSAFALYDPSASTELRVLTSFFSSAGLSSPALLNVGELGEMYLSGWKNSADELDALYSVNLTGDLATNQKNVKAVLALKGFQLNDPSALFAPVAAKPIFVYYGKLRDELAVKCFQAGKSREECPEVTQGSEVGLVVSHDRGATWRDQGTVLRGARMPSALAVGDEIFLYYLAGEPNAEGPLLRQRLKADGTTKIGAPSAVQLDGKKNGFTLLHVDVFAQWKNGRRYLLTGSDAKNKNPLYESTDGLHFNLITPQITSHANLLGPTITAANLDKTTCAVDKNVQKCVKKDEDFLKIVYASSRGGEFMIGTFASRTKPSKEFLGRKDKRFPLFAD